MAETLRAQNGDEAGVHPARMSWPAVAWKTAVALVLAIAVWWLMWKVIAPGADRGHWSRNLLVPGTILLSACAAALWHEKYWGTPMRSLFQLMQDIRAGDAPIEELSKIRGGPRPLVPLVQELFHEIRRQQVAVVQLNEEIRQRIALRTDALERQIGTLRQQAARDALTGLYNRRMLDTLLPKLLERCREQQSDLAVLMIDLDYFKQLNDSLGHSAGDDLLRNISSLIQSSLGQHDLAIRYGGDEFLVLKSNATFESAKELTHRLSALVEQLTRPLRLETPPRLSVGIAMLSQLVRPTPQQLLEAADRNLYEAKKARRTPTEMGKVCA